MRLCGYGHEYQEGTGSGCLVCRKRRNAEYQSQRTSEQLAKYAAKEQLHKQGQREAVLQFMGNVCVQCGYDKPAALQIDHVNGGGHKEGKWGPTLYKLVYANPQKYQLLCANCNWIKRAENKEFTQPRATSP